MVVFLLRMRTLTQIPKKELNMSGLEPIILSDLLFSKIPGSPKRKRIPLFVELTPTQLHIFEAVGTAKSSEGGAASSLTWSTRPGPSGDQEFNKGKHIRTLWRDHEEDVHNVRGVSRPGRRSHMYKFHIQRPDGLYKFKCFEEERRDRWLKELTTMTLTACDFTAPQGPLQTPTVTMLDPDGYEVDNIPSIPGMDIHDDDGDPYYYTAVSSRPHMHPWLEPLRSEGESKHYPLKRQPSTESDFAISRSSSMSRSESGYSSSDHELTGGGNGGGSRSASLKRMPNWEQLSQPTSPTDATKSFVMPLKVSRVPTKFAEDEEPEDRGVQLSDLRHLTKHLSLDSLSNLKSLSPVPEENEPADCENDSDLEVVYLLEESLEYQIGQDGTTISLIEDLGIAVDVPCGAIPADHLQVNDVIVKINACISGPFELPDGCELASPIFHIEPGVKFAEKVVELSMVHFIDLEDEDDCSELTFISAPLLKQNGQNHQSESDSDRGEKGMIRFKPLDGGMFWPGRRMGKISLQHFCLVGIAQLKREKGEKRDMANSSSILRPKPAALSQGKEGYTALLYSPVSFPQQLPRTYHVIFSISLSHPVFIKNLEKQLAKRFSIDSEFWRTSCKVKYAEDAIELEIPHDTLREYGCEVHTDLGCMISKRNVDDIRRSRLSRSDYASYIDYPPRILLRIHQTISIHQLTTPSRSTHHQPQQQIQHPKLKLKGTVEEQSFAIPLPASDTSSLSQQLLSPQHSQLETGSQPSTPTSGYSLRTDRRSLVSLPKQQGIHSVPDLKDLGEKVTPHLFPKWYHVGIQLGLPPVALTGMERQYRNDIRRCMTEVFYEWISCSEETPTWMTLIEALKADSINERQLASELERTLF